jgi:hypothetical protein
MQWLKKAKSGGGKIAAVAEQLIEKNQ